MNNLIFKPLAATLYIEYKSVVICLLFAWLLS